MMEKINWFGLAGGIMTVAVVIISVFFPWWQLIVGDNLVKASVSPVNTSFNFVGNHFTIPLMLALNIASFVLLTAGGVAMLIYSVKPDKAYSKRLLGFAYRKPLYSVVLFVVGLFLMVFLVKSLFSFDVPLIGATTSTLPADMTSGIVIRALMSAEFLWPFYLAAIATGLCIAARFYQNKIVPTKPL